jgi:hypothetical protein
MNIPLTLSRSLGFLALLSMSSCITPMPGDYGYNDGPGNGHGHGHGYSNAPAYSNRPGHGTRPGYGSGHHGAPHDRNPSRPHRHPSHHSVAPAPQHSSSGGSRASIRHLANGSIQSTLPGGCYVICDRNGRVIKDGSCSKADLIIATRAARDYLARRR